MALKHIEDKDNAENIEAARKNFGIDVAIENELIPPKVLKYIEYLEHEWAAENHQVSTWITKYRDCRDKQGEAKMDTNDKSDSPAEIMGMWPTEPGHTFIRGLWRVSEKMIGDMRTEEYELLSENPDELATLRAENARLRAALGDVLRFVQINEPDNTHADLVVNLDMDGWQTGTRSKLGTDDLGHALKRAADALTARGEGA